MNKNINLSYTLSTFIFFCVFVAIFRFQNSELNIQGDFLSYSASIIEETIDCISKSKERRFPPTFKLASQEIRQKNYEEIIEATEEWRPNPPKTHTYKGYSGPWIEHYFYMHFLKYKNVSHFNGLIPVFVPWLDIEVRYRYASVKIYKKIFSLFRDDCLYFTVSQCLYGLENNLGYENLPWNLLILSSGGHGNVAVPHHIKRQKPLKNFTNEIRVSFVGSEKSYTRKLYFDKIRDKYPNFISYLGPDWVNYVSKTMLNMAPRGVGATSFRVFELIELGSVPVIVWDKRIWLPYYGKLDYSKFSFLYSFQQIDEVLDLIQNINQSQIDKMRKNVLEVRDEYFTPEGNMKQIELFLRGGFSGSNLVCEYHYDGKKERMKKK